MIKPKKNNKISIYGSCVSRDIFGMHENNGGYEIISFIQSNSPLSAISPKILTPPNKIKTNDPALTEIWGNMSGFLKKMLALDLNKDAFTYLKKNQSDYIMLDATSCRHTLLKFQDSQTGNNIYITNTDMNKIEQLLAANGISISKADIVTFTSVSDNNFDDYMELFAQNLLQICDEEHLILNESYPVPFNINNSSIEAFNYDAVSATQTAIERGYGFFRKRFPNAHVIEFPEYVIGDANHKWGTYFLHYVPEYYDYGLEAINIITQENVDYETEKQKLAKLKRDYKSIFQKKYTPVFSNFLTMQTSSNKNRTPKSKLYDHPYLSNYVTARIDIKNFGLDTNDLEILEITASNTKVQKPLWFNKDGTGYIIQSDAGCLNMRFRVIGTGKLKIFLRGLDIRDIDGKRIPIFINFTCLCINGRNIFSENMNVCHDQPYVFQCQTQDNQIFAIYTTWDVHDERKYHHYDI